ncbi:MAG: choice-of-anchor X domain-containing protein [Myxococcota bacterium]
MLRLLFITLIALFSSGCVIGTWPQPESDDDGVQLRNPNDDDGRGSVTAGEACDEVDDDGDGVIDEGCVCDEPASFERGCVGRIDEQCATGVQRCTDGVLTECEDLVATGVAAVMASIDLATDAISLTPDGAETLAVRATPRPACDGVLVPEVRVTLRVAAPAVEIRAMARDDGAAPDAVASDGVYSTNLPNPLGPSVAAQSLELEAVVILDQVEVTDSEPVILEETQ